MFEILTQSKFPTGIAADQKPVRRKLNVGRFWLSVAGCALLLVLLSAPNGFAAQPLPQDVAAQDSTGSIVPDFKDLISPEKASGTFKTVLLLSVISLVPAIALMTTSFVRIVIVLGILRQALGAQQIPSTQIVTGLALFMSFLIMMPVWNQVKNDAIDPYTNPDSGISVQEAWARGSRPVKNFMSRQIAAAGNVDDIWLFYQYLPEDHRQEKPEKFDDIPIQVLLPAFMISELKVAFLIGFQVLMPFLIIDLVVTSVTTSLGMIMLPPTMVSLPLKLIMFVLLDGWNLIVGMLMQSFSLPV